MSKQLLIGMGVILVVVVIVAFGYVQISQNTPSNVQQSNTLTKTPAPATGNPDDIINQAISGSTTIDNIIKQSDSETQSLINNSNSLNNLSGVYNANEIPQ